jgi:CubicO group peptidase (beta-lactamase class C family)
MRRPAGLVAFAIFAFSAQPGFGQPASPAPAPTLSAQPSPSPTAVPVADAVDAVAKRLIASKRVPGLAVAVERHGVVVEEAYGYADVAKKVPVTTDTRFEIGSVTKQFTAACVLQLADAGKLSLDDRLGKYVSDYFVGRGVTVRQLLEQTSGIPEYLDGADVVEAASTQPATYATILDRVSAKPLDFPPGTRWEYSNTNYILLGRIIEFVAREKYETYVREHVCEPAGMTQSGFIDDEATLPAMARGYSATVTGVAPAPALREDWAQAAGGIVSTVGDVVKWDDALLAGKIVPPADVTLMGSDARLIDGSPTHYGFGWLVDDVGGHPHVWHNGGTFGFHAVNATFPSDDETIVMLGNSTSGLESSVSDIFAKTHPDVAAALDAVVPGEDPAVTARAKEWLHRFETDDIDRSQLTATMSTLLTPELTAELQRQFAPLGVPQSLSYRGKVTSGTSTIYRYLATYPTGTFVILIGIDTSGKISGYRLLPP